MDDSPDETYQNALRVIQLISGDGFEKILVGEDPPANFNIDVIIFNDDTLLDKIIAVKKGDADIDTID